MKAKTETNLDGSVTLTLGTHKSVTFAVNPSINEVIAGVEALIEMVMGVSAFELIQMVINAYASLAEQEEEALVAEPVE